MYIFLLKVTQNTQFQSALVNVNCLIDGEITNFYKKIAFLNQLIPKFVPAKRYLINSKIFPWHRENLKPCNCGAFLLPLSPPGIVLTES